MDWKGGQDIPNMVEQDKIDSLKTMLDTLKDWTRPKSDEVAAFGQIPHQNPTKVHRYNPNVCQRQQGFSQYLRSVHLGKEEELVSFDVSALFTSIPVSTVLDVINWLFTEHIENPEAKGKYNCTFEVNVVGLKKNEAMNLLKLVLENCVFLFQGNFFQQLHGAAMGSPCSIVVANIYMEYFEDLALVQNSLFLSRNGKGI